MNKATARTMLATVGLIAVFYVGYQIGLMIAR